MQFQLYLPHSLLIQTLPGALESLEPIERCRIAAFTARHRTRCTSGAARPFPTTLLNDDVVGPHAVTREQSDPGPASAGVSYSLPSGGAATKPDVVVYVVAGVVAVAATREVAAGVVEGAAAEAADSRLAGTAATVLPLPDITTEVVGAGVKP